MTRFNGLSKLVLLSALVGCGFNPGEAGVPTGSGASSGTTGAGGATGVGASSGIGASPGIGLTSGGGGDVGIGGSSCGQTNVQVNPEPPDILIVQDKSLSMDMDASGANCTTAGCSKWSQVSTAMASVVGATDTNVNWGLVFFGTDNQCGVTSRPVVPVAPMSGSKVQMAFATNQPSSYTPTASAVDAAVTYMKTLTDTNPKYLLLATDGLPNCGTAGGRNNTTADDSPAAEAAITNAKNAGFPTFVVGIATDSDQMATTTLNTMAVNGGYPQQGAATQYYSVSDTAGLEAVLNQIVGMVASCTIPLTNVPSNLTNVAVSAQDSSGKTIEIQQDPNNGWSYMNNMTVIQLNGSACDNLQSGAYSNFQFLYACEGTVICIDRNPDGTCGDHPM